MTYQVVIYSGAHYTDPIAAALSFDGDIDAAEDYAKERCAAQATTRGKRVWVDFLENGAVVTHRTYQEGFIDE